MEEEQLGNFSKKNHFYYVSVTHVLFETHNFFKQILIEKTIKNILLIEKIREQKI